MTRIEDSNPDKPLLHKIKGGGLMPENKEEMTEERKEFLENYIMQVLFELYEDQTGAKYTWEKVGTKEKTA